LKNNLFQENTKFIVLAVIATFVSALILFLIFSSKIKSPQPTTVQLDNNITILWAKWKPADYLIKLCDDFTRETGIKVIVKQSPWDNFQNEFFKSMSEKSEKYDLVIGDSQWLGISSKKGYYIELTEWINSHRLSDSMTAASITGYSEYPVASKHYWAVPMEGDAMGFVYRKDLFENPDEKSAFKAKYGYELGVPQTWYQLRDIAEFFYRPEKKLYGISLLTTKDYDGITMAVDNLIWAWGAGLGNYQTFRVKGILNSKEGIQALEFYKKLYHFAPPESKDVFFEESNRYFTSGSVAMAINFFAFFPDLCNPKNNPYLKSMGFFSMPQGPKNLASSLGGQGISIISYSKKKEAALKFLEWLIQNRVQERWAEVGGNSCNKNVLVSSKFINAAPYNRAFMESMQMVRDFWTVPEYSQLLELSQKYWNEYLINENTSAEATMNGLANEWENIFEYAGYYKE